MRLLPWLANSSSPAMSPSAEEKKRTHHTDATYPGGTRDCWREQPRNYAGM